MDRFDEKNIARLFEKYGPLATYSQLAKQVVLPLWKIRLLFDMAVESKIMAYWPQVTCKGEVVYLLLSRKRELTLKQKFVYWFIQTFAN